jgi:hypothetical protein
MVGIIRAPDFAMQSFHAGPGRVRDSWEPDEDWLWRLLG